MWKEDEQENIPHQTEIQLFSLDVSTPYQLPLSSLRFLVLDRWEGGCTRREEGMQLTFHHHLIPAPTPKQVRLVTEATR